nr:MAG TPA: tail sheath protein [Caudoviricetes sp.]
MPVVTCAKTSLPRSLDVPISLSRSVAETATDMTMLCFVTPGVDFPTDNNRVQFFSTFDAVQAAVPENSEALFAAQAFFNRSDRPQTMCIGAVFVDPTHGTLTGGNVDLTSLANVSNGGFNIVIGDTEKAISGLTFDSTPTMNEVVTALNAALASSATVTAEGDSLSVTTTATGDGADIGFATSPANFTNINTLISATTATGATLTQGGTVTVNTPAQLNSGILDSAALTALENISDGSFDITINGDAVQVRDFVTGADVTLEALGTTLGEKLTGKATVVADTNNNMLVIRTVAEGTGTTIDYAVTASPAAGTDISALLKLTMSTATTKVNGRTDENEVPAKLTTGTFTPSALAEIKDGAFAITVNNVQQSVYDLDFTGFGPDITVMNVVSVLSSAFGSKLSISVTDPGVIVFSTPASGEGNTLSYGLPAPSVVDLSAILGLSQETYASKANGYTPGGLVSEAALIQTAARCAGRSIFAWTLDRKYRDTPDQKAFADWAEAQDQAYFSACTNSSLAYNTADSTNIGFYANNKGYIKTSVFYHNNPQVYPDVSYAALALSVNYALENSTLTMKFKQLTGIETVPLTETQLSALASRRINTYVSMGNSSSVVREGVQSADSWFTDSHVNLSNYKEELQVEVFNVFMRNKKVPYTAAGQDLLVSAATKINSRYTRNGTFADREEETTDNETGYTTLPATTIIPAPVYSATTSERANRIAPPISIVAYEAGAFHSVAIDVTVYN